LPLTSQPAHIGDPKMTANGDMIIALDQARFDAMAALDMDRLNGIVADDLIYTHSSARMDTKTSFLAAMSSGSTVYKSVVVSEVTAQDLGDTVVLTGQAQISIESSGKPVSFGVRFTDVYANRGGKWQMVTWQSTKTG
jgi:ketosteroid isomerase-like protein